MYGPLSVLALRALAGSLVVAAVCAGSVSAQSPFANSLSGAAEVPGPGSPTGSGTFSVNVNADQGTVCYDVTVTLTPAASAAHIHRGDVGAAGPVVVPFDAPSSGASSCCVQGVDPALIADILQNPAGFYVNVHNPDFPAGAIRGQLTQ